MSKKLIDNSCKQFAEGVLEELYQNKKIPAEKKTYLADLKNSVGPYLGIEKNCFILDAASQIASLGLGFNKSSLFGTAHYLEAWLNTKDSEDFKNLKQSFINFLARKLNRENVSAFFCNSGSEANEIALGQAYKKEKKPKRKKSCCF